MARIDDRRPAPLLDRDAIERLVRALDCEDVVAARLFGSQAAGRVGPLSDVDVAVWLDPRLTLEERLAARLRLSAAAADALGGEEVDLVVLNDATPLLKHRALGSTISLVERDPKMRVLLDERALLEYLDTKPLREELARGMRRRLKEGGFGRP